MHFFSLGMTAGLSVIETFVYVDRSRRGLDKSEVENARACMGDTVVGQLRFLALSPEEFCKGPAKSGLLTRDECYAVFMNMAIPGIVALPKGWFPEYSHRE